METFKIKYQGQMIDVIKTNDGGYKVILPTQIGKNGTKIEETITRVQDGWRFSSIEPEDPESFFHVFLNDDGTVKWTNDLSSGQGRTARRFNPQLCDKTDLIDKVCMQIYDVVQGIYDYVERGIDAEKVVGLRKIYLRMMLKMLGYSSTDRVKKEFDVNKSYMALSRVADMLEKYVNIAQYYKQKTPGVYEVSIPEDMSTEELKAKIISMGEDIKKLNEKMEVEDDLKQTNRTLLPTYGLTMRDEVPQEEWDVYSTNVSRVAELLLELNYDIVPEMDKITLKDETGLDGLELDDRISRVIDTKEFAEACHTEDAYVQAENERMAQEIDRLIDGSERVINSSIGDALNFIKKQALILRDTRQEYIDKYKEIEELYYSKLGIKKTDEPTQDEVKGEEGVEPYDE